MAKFVLHINPLKTSELRMQALLHFIDITDFTIKRLTALFNFTKCNIF